MSQLPACRASSRPTSSDGSFVLLPIAGGGDLVGRDAELQIGRRAGRPACRSCTPRRRARGRPAPTSSGRPQFAVRFESTSRSFLTGSSGASSSRQRAERTFLGGRPVPHVDAVRHVEPRQPQRRPPGSVLSANAGVMASRNGRLMAAPSPLQNRAPRKCLAGDDHLVLPLRLHALRAAAGTARCARSPAPAPGIWYSSAGGLPHQILHGRAGRNVSTPRPKAVCQHLLGQAAA